MPKTNASSCLAGVLQNGIFTDISISPCLGHCSLEQEGITGTIGSNILMLLYLIYSLINETYLFMALIYFGNFYCCFLKRFLGSPTFFSCEVLIQRDSHMLVNKSHRKCINPAPLSIVFFIKMDYISLQFVTIMCYLQFMNQREKLALVSWILNEIVDSLHFLLMSQEKAFIWFSIVHGKKIKLGILYPVPGHFLKSKLIEIISNTYCCGKSFQYTS